MTEEEQLEQDLYEQQCEEEAARQAERDYYRQMMYEDWLREQEHIERSRISENPDGFSKII